MLMKRLLKAYLRSCDLGKVYLLAEIGSTWQIQMFYYLYWKITDQDEVCMAFKNKELQVNIQESGIGLSLWCSSLTSGNGA
jgi:hypothetical protein